MSGAKRVVMTSRNASAAEEPVEKAKAKRAGSSVALAPLLTAEAGSGQMGVLP